jgi:hypothetical protein
VTVLTTVQLFAPLSVTVTEYVPAKSPVTEAVAALAAFADQA